MYIEVTGYMYYVFDRKNKIFEIIYFMTKNVSFSMFGEAYFSYENPVLMMSRFT